MLVHLQVRTQTCVHMCARMSAGVAPAATACRTRHSPIAPQGSQRPVVSHHYSVRALYKCGPYMGEMVLALGLQNRASNVLEGL